MSSTASKICCNLQDCKSAGVFKCEGCSQIYCRKHSNEHRDFLAHELDQIVFEYDTLQQMVADQESKENNYQSLLKYIDKWEQESIFKIQERAGTVRKEIEEFIISQKESISKQMHTLAEKLGRARMEDDFIEGDLQRWTNMLEQIKGSTMAVASSPLFYEDPDKLLVAQIFLVKPEQTILENDERFGESFGNVSISQGDLLVCHTARKRQNAFVRGSKEYSSGKYKIRFIMNKKDASVCMSFNIVPKSTFVNNNDFNLRQSSYGWCTDDTMCNYSCDFLANMSLPDMQGETRFEIELLLDCDNHKIGYFNERTQNRREMNIDIQKCPFPWQLFFYLFDVEDSIQLISSTKIL